MSRRIQSDLIICRDCDTIYEYKHTKVRQPVHCTVCGHHLYEKKTRFIHRGFSFALTALILFIPANLFSLINLDKVGNNRNAVVFDGVIDFFRYGKVACGISLFLFCMIFPLIHSFTQAYVCFGLLYKVKLPGMVKALKIHQKVAYWTMIDVYILAFFVVLIKLGDIAHVKLMTGIFFVFAYLIASLAANYACDNVMLWRRLREFTYDE